MSTRSTEAVTGNWAAFYAAEKATSRAISAYMKAPTRANFERWELALVKEDGIYRAVRGNDPKAARPTGIMFEAEAAKWRLNDLRGI